MVYDINQYGVHREHKATSTLKAMTKAELIEYIRTLEHDYNVAVDSNERQARNIEKMMKDGRTIILPCAIGDTVYVFGKFHHGIEEEKVKEFRITEDCIRVMADPWDGEICEAHQIGKTVKSDYETNGYYLSITEAAEAKQAWEEAKLKELEGDKE